MTEHFFCGDGGEKEAGHQYQIKAHLQPASFSPPSHYQHQTVIASAAKQSVPVCSNKNLSFGGKIDGSIFYRERSFLLV
jgi:hypothetical protein